MTSAFRWESGRLLARWLLTRSEISIKQLKEYHGGNRKYHQALWIVFAVSIIANTRDTRFGLVPVIEVEKELQCHDILGKQ